MDLQVDDYSVIRATNNADFFDYLPVPNSTIPLGVISRSPVIENIDGDDVFSYTNKNPFPWPYDTPPADSSGVTKKDQFSSLPVIYLNINNQEGFLNYYTEPTP